jgi:hypothetical protein
MRILGCRICSRISIGRAGDGVGGGRLGDSVFILALIALIACKLVVDSMTD